MTSKRPLWMVVVGGVILVLVSGLGLGCGGEGDDETAASTNSVDSGATTLHVTTTFAATTTVPEEVDITEQLVGVWECTDMPEDYTIEFTAYGYGETFQEGEAGDIVTEFEYEAEGYLVTLWYVDDTMQTLELSVDGSVLTEAGPGAIFSFKRR